MSASHGKDQYFNMDDTGGTPTDYSAYVDNVEGLPGDVDMADVTTATLEDYAYLAGLAGAEVTVSGPFDTVLSAAIGTSAQRKTARTCVWGPGGNSTPKWTFEAFIMSYKITSDVKDANRYSMVLKPTGAITLS